MVPEYGVKPYWNFLYGFPGETAADYDESLGLIEAIWHLEPPTGVGPVRLDRFSPYHADPAGLGMVNVRPMAPFSYLYPFERETLMEIAYYFDYDHEDGRADDAYAREAIALVRTWMAETVRGSVELSTIDEGTIEILDTRPRLATPPRRAVLHGWKAAVYLACDRAQPLENLQRARRRPARISTG